MKRESQTEWAQWMRNLGTQARSVREFLGLSQDQLARLGGVSQGAVSRLEAGRGLATPHLVVLKLHRALAQALAGVDPSALNTDLLRLLETGQRRPFSGADLPSSVLPITKQRDLEEIIRAYREVPERRRQAFLAIVRATAVSLGRVVPTKSEDEP